MATLSDLIAKRDAIEAQIKEQTQSQRAEAIDKIKSLMQEAGVTLSDLGGKESKGQGKGGAKTGTKVAAKYRDQAGNSWSGRGLPPKWLKAALSEGKKREDFAV